MAIVGIDLGTTNSLVSAWIEGKVQPIANALGSTLTPSAVSLMDDGTVLVGAAARERLITHPGQSASLFKRAMGTEQVFWLGKRAFRAEELSALVLKSLKADAEARLGETVDRAVISVPAYFNEIQRKATKAAAHMAGLKVDRLINEPTAAAIAYGIEKIQSEGMFLVLDLGGGTFDVSILELFERTLEVHASSGDTRLGGEDFRWRLAQAFLKENRLHWDDLTPPERAILMHAAEASKMELSRDRTSLMECRLGGQDLAWPVTREHFENLCEDLLSRLRRPVERALSDAKLAPEKIDQVLLVGGATRMPMVGQMAERLLGRAPLIDLDPDRVVAVGAGVQAMLMTCEAAFEDVVMTDVCPWSLGVEVMSSRIEADPDASGDFSPIIERNTTVPVSRCEIYSPVHPKQKAVELKIYQGESRRVENNILLGKLDIQFLPDPDLRHNTIEVRFTYDVNGLLEVEATHVRSSRKWHLVIEKNPGTLTPEQIQQRLEALAPLKLHPRNRQEYRHLLAVAERLYEDSLGEKRELLGHAMRAFEAVLSEQDTQACEESAERLRNLLRDVWDVEL
jgi:molecular chaperone HscC